MHSFDAISPRLNQPTANEDEDASLPQPPMAITDLHPPPSSFDANAHEQRSWDCKTEAVLQGFSNQWLCIDAYCFLTGILNS